MDIQPSDFTENQWSFLANLEVCGLPIPVSVSHRIAPPKDKIRDEFITRCQMAGWLEIDRDDQISLTPALPKAIRYELQLMNTPDRVSALLELIQTRGIDKQLDRRVMIKLLSDTGKNIESSEMEVALVHEILALGDYDLAYRSMGRAVERLKHHIDSGKKGGEELFLKSALEYSNLCFVVGRRMHPLLTYLQAAVKLAESFGDQRFQALGCLYLGKLEAYFGNLTKGLKLMKTGKSKVEDLGDSDIFKAGAECIGFYHVMLGEFDQAIIHFERAEQNFIQNEDQTLFYPVILWHLGICLFFTGQIARALGFLKNYWLLAEGKGWRGVALISRSLLGMSLAVIKKREAAVYHLDAVIREALDDNNAYALFIARAGLAIKWFGENKRTEAYGILKKASANVREATSAPLWSSFYFIDLISETDPLEIDILKREVSLINDLERLFRGSNTIGLYRAISLRLSVVDRLRKGETTPRVEKDLETSCKLLGQAGIDYGVNNTMISIARLHLSRNDAEKAGMVAAEIWQKTKSMGLGLSFLPNDIRHLLKHSPPRPDQIQHLQTGIRQFFNVMNKVTPGHDEDSLTYNAVTRLLQFLRAERGAFLWRDADTPPKKWKFIAGCNLSEKETLSKHFSPGFALVRKAFEEKRIIVKRCEPEPDKPDWTTPQVVMAIPFSFGPALQGMAYFDNIFVKDAFEALPLSVIQAMCNHLACFISNLIQNTRLRSEIVRLHSFTSSHLEKDDMESIITNDDKMLEVLGQARKAALSETTLLVTGETGTGKELLVNWSHSLGRRSNETLMIVDATVIPENLVESELFGHEKGAFTGADSLKRGRIELAHKGTLFIDEIGELPLLAQAKLLRALETKKICRIGGTQYIKSDFWLVAATHRNLAEEVAAGRFRQDLYYRLNVITCELPPLRERGQDILRLSSHFLEQYCRQQGFPKMRFDSNHETRLLDYPWPGNVRELKNAVERSVILSNGRTPALDLPSAPSDRTNDIVIDMPSMEEMQRRYIQKVLSKTGGRIKGPDGAAGILGMKRSTLYSRMYKLGIRTPSNS